MGGKNDILQCVQFLMRMWNASSQRPTNLWHHAGATGIGLFQHYKTTNVEKTKAPCWLGPPIVGTVGKEKPVARLGWNLDFWPTGYSCSESQSIWLATNCTPYVYLPDGSDQALKTHTHTYTYQNCLRRSGRLFTPQGHRERNVNSPQKDFCFFKVRILKWCLIKPTFSNLTAYTINKPHFGHFQGKISFNSQLSTYMFFKYINLAGV